MQFEFAAGLFDVEPTFTSQPAVIGGTRRAIPDRKPGTVTVCLDVSQTPPIVHVDYTLQSNSEKMRLMSLSCSDEPEYEFIHLKNVDSANASLSRIYYLRPTNPENSSGKDRALFWMQSEKSNTDASVCKKFNCLLSGKPLPAEMDRAEEGKKNGGARSSVKGTTKGGATMAATLNDLRSALAAIGSIPTGGQVAEAVDAAPSSSTSKSQTSEWF